MNVLQSFDFIKANIEKHFFIFHTTYYFAPWLIQPILDT